MIVNGCHNAPLQSVGTAPPGTAWETMQGGWHVAVISERTSLCSIQQGTAGEVGVLKKTGRFEGGAHMGRTQAEW